MMDVDMRNTRPSAATLCQDCQALQFDDSRPEFTKLTAEGHECHAETRSYSVAKLDYEVHDSLPELPRLRRSADGGCHFCRFLRDTLLLNEEGTMDESIRSYLAEQRDVAIKLQYGWSKPESCALERPCTRRMMILTAVLSPPFTDDCESLEDDLSVPCSFLVEGCDGDSPPLHRGNVKAIGLTGLPN